MYNQCQYYYHNHLIMTPLTFQMLTNALEIHVNTIATMFAAVTHVVVIHATLKLELDVNCDSAVLLVHVIAMVQCTPGINVR